MEKIHDEIALPSQEHQSGLRLRINGLNLNLGRGSALRQWLNSDAGAGQWWTPQHDFDMPPAETKTKAGGLTGYENED